MVSLKKNNLFAFQIQIQKSFNSDSQFKYQKPLKQSKLERFISIQKWKTRKGSIVQGNYQIGIQ